MAGVMHAPCYPDWRPAVTRDLATLTRRPRRSLTGSTVAVSLGSGTGGDLNSSAMLLNDAATLSRPLAASSRCWAILDSESLPSACARRHSWMPA